MTLKQLATAAAWSIFTLASGEASQIPTRAVEVSRLEVNLSTQRHTIFRGDEQTGVKQIRKLLEQSPYEESWAYLPKKKLWVETGLYSEINAKNCKIFLGISKSNYKLEEKLIRENNEIIMYHFHPEPTIAYKEVEKKLRQENCSEETIAAKKIFFNDVSAAMPNVGDIRTTINVSYFFHNLYPRGKISYKVVSKLGVTEIKATDIAKGKQFTRQMVTQALTMLRHYNTFSRSYIRNRDRTDSLRAIAFLTEQSKTPYATASFTSFRN